VSIFEELSAVFKNRKAVKINYKPGGKAMANVTVDLEKSVKLCD